MNRSSLSFGAQVKNSQSHKDVPRVASRSLPRATPRSLGQPRAALLAECGFFFLFLRKSSLTLSINHSLIPLEAVSSSTTASTSSSSEQQGLPSFSALTLIVHHDHSSTNTKCSSLSSASSPLPLPALLLQPSWLTPYVQSSFFSAHE